MSKAGAVRCGAWIDNSHSPVIGAKRLCVLAAGHYVQEDEGAGAQSWHTDCPDVVGDEYPPGDHYQHQHGGTDHPCMVWGDQADGAHPSDVVISEPEDDESTSFMESVMRSASDGPVKETGRTLGTSVIGGYRADIKIGDTSMSVYGPAKFVANVVRTFADAFEEEAER